MKNENPLFLKHAKIKRFLENRPLIKYTLELLTIVLGISISFAIENWRDEKQEESVYKTVLEEIIMDMKLDSANYSNKLVAMRNMEDMLKKVITHQPLSPHEVKEWFYTTTGNMGGITVREGGYQHWRSTPGISFKSTDLSQKISTYYHEIRNNINKHNAQIIDNFERAQDYIINDPVPILTSFHEDDKRFEKGITSGRFSNDVEEQYRELLKNPTYFYLTEVKLYLIINEKSLCSLALEHASVTLQSLTEELKELDD